MKNTDHYYDVSCHDLSVHGFARCTAATPYLLLALGLLLSGCALDYHPESPEVRYSKNSSEAAALQVPPDLTDLSEGEQFVLPGTTGVPTTRDTLLPLFESARYQRNEQQSWLLIDTAAEKVWPQLLRFLRSERMPVARTEPTTGLIVSQWQSPGAASSDKDAYHRIAFRLERAGSGSRLFARSQQASKSVATEVGADSALWPAQSHSPEQTSLLLQRLLVFIGLEEQQAREVLTEQAALEVLDAAILEVDAGTSRLLLFQGYQSAMQTLTTTLTSMGFEMGRSAGTGSSSIRVIDAASVIGADALAYTLSIEPIHVSAVKVSVLDADGNPAKVVDARKLLGFLQTRLARTRIV